MKTERRKWFPTALLALFFVCLLTAMPVMAKAEDVTAAERRSAISRAGDYYEDDNESRPVSLPVMVGIIAAIAVAALALIMALFYKGKKSDDTETGMAGPPQQRIPPTVLRGETGGPVIPPYSGGVDTGVLNQGAIETTELERKTNDAALIAGERGRGVIVRKKTGETVTINKERFCIGRERSRVDFCISDNTAVGRLHAIVFTRDGKRYIVDQNSRNFTFVNDVRSPANTETELKSGDRIALGDEDLIFQIM